MISRLYGQNYSLAIRRRDLSTKKTKPSIENDQKASDVRCFKTFFCLKKKKNLISNLARPSHEAQRTSVWEAKLTTTSVEKRI